MDQAIEQSNLTTDEAANALMDYLDAEDSLEESPDATEEPNADLDDVEQDDIEETTDDEQEELEEDSPDDDDEELSAYELGDDDLLTIDGQEISFKELREGYMRQADYTRKTQEVAEQRKTSEQEQAQFTQQSNAYLQQLGSLTQNLQAMVMQDQQIDWNRLREESPNEYLLLKEQARERQDALNQSLQAQQYAQHQAQEEQQKRQKAYVQEQLQTVQEMWPDWKDDGKRRTHQQQLSSYLQTNGFTQEEVGSLADARTLSLVEKARKYDELQKAKPNVKKRAKQAPKVQKPQSKKTKAQLSAQARDKQIKRLQKTGSVQDAASLLMQSGYV